MGTVTRMDVLIRQPSESEFSEWRDLWVSYLDFYETELPSGHDERLWERVLDSESIIACHVAEGNSRLVGFVHFLPHEDTWNTSPICYLQDLYVDVSHRGDGIGAKLVNSVVEQAKTNGWSAVYWLTEADNHEARILYDRLTRGTTGFIHYEMEANPPRLDASHP